MTRRRIAFAAVGEQPFSAINTTPIIDVMLVLLIMFIITLPLTTHSVKIDLPADGPAQREPEYHRLVLDTAGGLSWDGARIAEADLPARLAVLRAGSRDDVLLFRTESETRYEDFDRVLAHVKRSGLDRLAFDGNDRFARTY